MGTGTDIYGFNLLPGGYRQWNNNTWIDMDMGQDAYFWLSTYTNGIAGGGLMVNVPSFSGTPTQWSYRSININSYAYIRCLQDM